MRQCESTAQAEIDVNILLKLEDLGPAIQEPQRSQLVAAVRERAHIRRRLAHLEERYTITAQGMAAMDALEV